MSDKNQPGTKVNLVLLGMSGTGKSATGNTILGKRQFESKTSSMPITTECEAAETEINGRRVRVIDTPDIFNDEIKSPVKNQHVAQCKQLCQSDPCIYLLVMQVGRFTDGERDILKKFEAAFGSRAKEQTIILFTRGENLQRAKMSLEDFVQDCQPELKNIIKQCGGRCSVFENKTSRQCSTAFQKLFEATVPSGTKSYSKLFNFSDIMQNKVLSVVNSAISLAGNTFITNITYYPSAE